MNERRKAVEELDQDEKVKIPARYAVAMRLETWKRIGNAPMYVIIFAALTALYASSYWPLVIAAAINAMLAEKS